MADDDLLASMYDDEPGDVLARPTAPIDPRVRKIKVGIIEYEVPSLDYVRNLERTLIQQAALLDSQRRTLARLEASLIGTRNHVRRSDDVIGDLRTTMGRKVDRS